MTNKWDSRFLQLARLVSTWSKDSTKVGAVIADGNKVVSIGYNGYPIGILDVEEDRLIKLYKTIHAEENAILFAKRDLSGCSIYITHPPCARCAAKIIQSGLYRVVTLKPLDSFYNRWKEELDVAESMFSEAGINYYQVI